MPQKSKLTKKTTGKVIQAGSTKPPALAGRVLDKRGSFVFAPGVSGNPVGKVPGTKNLTTKIREALVMLSSAKGSDGKNISYESALVKTVLKKAIVDEDVSMIKLIWNYLDGFPVQPLDHGGTIETELDQETKNKIDKIFERNMRRPQ